MQIACFLIIFVLLCSCNSEMSDSLDAKEHCADTLFWNHQAPIFYQSIVKHGDSDSLRIDNLMYEDWDTLKLEVAHFSSPGKAFSHFSSLVHNQAELFAGLARRGSYLYFLDGNCIGQVHYAARGFLALEAFRSKFGLPKMRIPTQFEAFPFEGRIKESERAYYPIYHGLRLTNEVYSVAFDCGVDTAQVFLIPTVNPMSYLNLFSKLALADLDTLSWSANSFRIKLNSPEGFLEVWGQKAYVAGVWACPDPGQREIWLSHFESLGSFESM